MQMQIPSNLPVRFIISELVIGFIISIFIFFYGLSFIKSYVKRKEWDDANFGADLTLIWFLLKLAIDFIFLFFIGTGNTNSIISDVLTIVIGIGISFAVLSIFNNMDTKESLILSVIFQVVLYGMITLLQVFLDVINFMVSSNETDVFGAGLMFLFIGMLLVGINSFYINSGDKAHFM